MQQAVKMTLAHQRQEAFVQEADSIGMLREVDVAEEVHLEYFRAVFAERDIPSRANESRKRLLRVLDESQQITPVGDLKPDDVSTSPRMCGVYCLLESGPGNHP